MPVGGFKEKALPTFGWGRQSAWLSPAERSELAALLAGPAPSPFPGTVYQALLALWNDQNEGDGFHVPADEDAAMPDHSRLPGPPLP